MPVERDEQGRRFVQAEVQVPGTPEQVWQAIATGPGVSSWFVPTTIHPGEGGQVISHFSPDGSMDSLSTITEWAPPHRYACDSRDDMGPDAPTIGTEWIVEAQSGGHCTVRVVHRWFTDKDDWDAQFQQHAEGWGNFFRILKAVLTHFPGQPSALIQVMGSAQGDKDAVWAAWMQAMGLPEGMQSGQRLAAGPQAPGPWAGEALSVGSEWPELLLKLDSPGPGLAHLVPHEMMGQVHLTFRMAFFGPEAEALAKAAEAAWTPWMAERWPMVPWDVAAAQAAQGAEA